jgi:hypothetical protein
MIEVLPSVKLSGFLDDLTYLHAFAGGATHMGVSAAMPPQAQQAARCLAHMKPNRPTEQNSPTSHPTMGMSSPPPGYSPPLPMCNGQFLLLRGLQA